MTAGKCIHSTARNRNGDSWMPGPGRFLNRDFYLLLYNQIQKSLKSKLNYICLLLYAIAALTMFSMFMFVEGKMLEGLEGFLL